MLKEASQGMVRLQQRAEPSESTRWIISRIDVPDLDEAAQFYTDFGLEVRASSRQASNSIRSEIRIAGRRSPRAAQKAALCVVRRLRAGLAGVREADRTSEASIGARPCPTTAGSGFLRTTASPSRSRPAKSPLPIERQISAPPAPRPGKSGAIRKAEAHGGETSAAGPYHAVHNQHPRQRSNSTARYLGPAAVRSVAATSSRSCTASMVPTIILWPSPVRTIRACTIQAGICRLSKMSGSLLSA